MNCLHAHLPGTTLSEGLLAAYRATEYRVHSSDEHAGFTLRIGTLQTDLLSLMKQFEVASAAYITAWNPLGMNLSEAVNQSRQDALQKVLKERSLPYWPGIGQGTLGNWPGEESFLILGLDLAAAKRLASDFEQNALVWVGADAVPKLVLLR